MKSPYAEHTDVSQASHAGGLRAYIEVFLAVLVAAVVLKIFVIGVIDVPSHSMEGTIVSGDYLIVNKLIYGARSPKHFPFLTAGFPSFKMPGLRNVQRGDVIVFEFPVHDVQRNPYGETYFVKRCVAVAGDTLSIDDGIVMINRKRYSFPGDIDNKNSENVEPLVVPKSGDVVMLNDNTYPAYANIIIQEGHSVERLSENIFFIDGVKTNSYIIQQNYLYVLGDNRSHSYDSRAWGFLPETNVVGQATVVYWSVNPSTATNSVNDFFDAIQWKRIAKFIQ